MAVSEIVKLCLTKIAILFTHASTQVTPGSEKRCFPYSGFMIQRLAENAFSFVLLKPWMPQLVAQEQTQDKCPAL